MLTKHLNTEFEDAKALFQLGYVMMKSDSTGLGFNFLKRSAELDPGQAATWHNIAKCYHDIQKPDLAEEYFRRALKVDPSFSSALEGMSMICLENGDFDGGIGYANRALVDGDGADDARINRGMAYLALKRWREGWRDYNTNIGIEKNRKEYKYGDEPRWDGTKGKDIILYTEQGLGDELSFGTVIPDLVRDSKSVTIECDGRIEGLFKRSFPMCEVHGTRYKEKRPAWCSEKKFDARVAAGYLPQVYRLKDSDFHGKPYLIPHPQMAMQWRVLLDSLGPKPKIGLAWAGGIPKTGQRRRTVTLDTLSPLFKFDADWISLQYKDYDEIPQAEEKYGIKIHDWDWGVRVRDYDQTVALISELDLVISVCTSVVHAAGGLGKECWCLVPQVPMWRYLKEGSWFPWASSVTLYRQKGREWPVHTLAAKLKEKFGDNLKRQAA